MKTTQTLFGQLKATIQEHISKMEHLATISGDLALSQANREHLEEQFEAMEETHKKIKEEWSSIEFETLCLLAQMAEYAVKQQADVLYVPMYQSHDANVKAHPNVNPEELRSFETVKMMNDAILKIVKHFDAEHLFVIEKKF